MFRVTKILDIKGKKELLWVFFSLVTKKTLRISVRISVRFLLIVQPTEIAVGKFFDHFLL